MAKFAVLFFAALAFQATIAQQYYYHQQQNQHHGGDVQDLLSQVHSVSLQASNSIQGADSHQHTHALYSQANEFAHNIHEVAYHLQHVIHHSEEGHSQQLLEHVVRILREAVHSIEQAIHHEPSVLKAQLKVQIQNVAAEAERLVQVVQQAQPGSHHIGEEVQDALDDLLTAIQQLQIRNNIENRSQLEIKNYIQTVVSQAVNTIEGVVSTDSEGVVEDLVHHAHHYGHHLGNIVHRLEKEVHNHNIHDKQIRNVLQQVTDNLGEIHSALEQVGHHSHQGLGQLHGSFEQAGHDSYETLGQLHGSLEGVGQHSHEGLGLLQGYGSIQSSTRQVIQDLETSVRGVAVQLERLVQLVHSSNIKEHETHNVRDLVHTVVAHSLVATRQLQRQVEHTVHHVGRLNQEI